MQTKTGSRKAISLVVVVAVMVLSVGLLSLPVPTQAASRQLTLTPINCTTATPVANPTVSQVTTPTNMRTQVVVVHASGPIDWVQISGPGGVFTATERVNGNFPVTVTLKPGTNTLLVLAHVVASDISGCKGGDYTVSTSAAIERILACPAMPIYDLLVQPVITQTIAYTQVVRAQMASADAVTVSVAGATQTVLFAGYRELGDWFIPVNLRPVGASGALSGIYTLTVTAHAPAVGDPECGFDDRLVSKSEDINGNPLVITLGPAICPAVAAQPVRVNPVVSTTRAFTQTISGEKSGATDRVLVRLPASVVTATLSTPFTWHATVLLSPASQQLVTVEGIDAADTLCEQVSQTQVDRAGKPLLIQQIAERVWLPLAGR